jgi:[protein-PII] uridylyltransferase
MELSGYLAEIDSLKPGIDRTALLSAIRDIEGRFYADLRDGIASRYRRGAGVEVSRQLCEFKDAVVLKAVEWCGGIPEGISVVAVGGYGRGELCPYSDLDILVLHTEKARLEEFVHGFLYVLWDLNYNLGSSTRTIQNLIEHSREDVTFLTAVFEARYLAGDRDLYLRIETALQKVLAKTRLDFLRARIEDVHAMLRDSGIAVLMKEPSVKDNAGGLRSIHTMEWLNYAFRLKSGMRGLESLLGKNRYRRLYWANDFLLFIRNLLHFRAGRKEDHLYIDSQLAVSDAFGFHGTEERRMARLMRHFFDRSLEVLLLLLSVKEDFQMRFLKGVTDRARWERKNPQKDWLSVDGWLYVKEKTPRSVNGALALVLECARENLRASHSLIRYLQECIRFVNEDERTSQENFGLFRQILELENSYDALSTMKLSGFLYRYIPLFGKIRHRILYNPFHQYTVDQHSIEGVHALEKLFRNEFSSFERSKYLPFQEVADKYRDSLWILKLALLLHDTGKIYEGDHSKNGVELASRYLAGMPFYSTYKQVVLFLIRDHLMLSNLVRRTDISSMQVLQELRSELFLSPFPGEYMDFLFLMTYADVSATNPKHFTSYLSNMLSQVYRNVSALLMRELDENHMENLVESAAERIAAAENEPEARDFIRSMGAHYVLSSDDDTMVGDFRLVRSLGTEELRVQMQTFNDHFLVRIFIRDRTGLFSVLAGALALNGADVVRANIHTWKGIAMDAFTIGKIFGGEFTELGMKEELRLWGEDLEKLLRQFLDKPDALSERIAGLKQRSMPIPPAFLREGKADILKGEGFLYTIEISGTDRPALLYDVTRFLSARGFGIRDAIIDTTGWYIRDTFVTERADHPEEEWLEDCRRELEKLAGYSGE